jgi:hypothetical protein
MEDAPFPGLQRASNENICACSFICWSLKERRQFSCGRVDEWKWTKQVDIVTKFRRRHKLLQKSDKKTFRKGKKIRKDFKRGSTKAA